MTKQNRKPLTDDERFTLALSRLAVGESVELHADECGIQLGSRCNCIPLTLKRLATA